MANNDSDNRYKSGPDFDEDNRVPILPISLSHSTELWLIQWPINQLQPSDFHGKELSLKLHRDGKLASFDNSFGKSYEVVSFGAQEPDATVFLPSSSDSKVVGKISRRVCLVRYPEPGEFDKGSFSNPNMRLEGSKMKALSHLPTIHRHGSHGSQPVTDRSSRETLTSCHSIGQGILETPQQHSRKNKHEDRTPASTSMRSIGRAEPESQMNSTATGSAQSHGEKKSKKRKIKAED